MTDEKKATRLFNELYPEEQPKWRDWGKTWKERLLSLEEEKERRRRLVIEEQERFAEDSAWLFFYLHGDTINKEINKKRIAYELLSMSDLKKEYDKLSKKATFLNEIFNDDSFFMQHEKTYFMEQRIKECCDLNGQDFWNALEDSLGRKWNISPM